MAAGSGLPRSIQQGEPAGKSVVSMVERPFEGEGSRCTTGRARAVAHPDSAICESAPHH
ncbi:hypothetical protein GCM10009639_07590 [Kitasatospora putterlickiae]|uniref:Uncharacterized protein n=1 Tax=Kitasatospora putterlickiae TaxID=221725 RepID=A0ABN1XLZ7_9ACTN